MLLKTDAVITLTVKRFAYYVQLNCASRIGATVSRPGALGPPFVGKSQTSRLFAVVSHSRGGKPGQLGMQADERAKSGHVQSDRRRSHCLCKPLSGATSAMSGSIQIGRAHV